MDGLVVNAIGTATASASAIVTAVQGAISTSTSATTVVAVEPLAPAVSEREALSRVIVKTSAGVFALNDTGDTVTAATRRASVRLDLLRLITASSNNNFRLNTTSGLKVAAILALPVSGNTAAGIKSAVNGAL